MPIKVTQGNWTPLIAGAFGDCQFRMMRKGPFGLYLQRKTFDGSRLLSNGEVIHEVPCYPVIGRVAEEWLDFYNLELYVNDRIQVFPRRDAQKATHYPGVQQVRP